MRRSVCGFTALVVTSFACGCTTDRDWSVSRLLGWDDPQTTRPAKMPRADLALTERVETVGRKLIAQNMFTGIEPLFFTVGVPEAVLFHRGPEELIVSEGVVKQCKTDGELAAVLCSELAQMMNENKSARRVSDRDSFPEISVPTGSGLAGGAPDDPGRAAERAFQERNRQSAGARNDTNDPAKLARDLMRGAGYDPADLDRVAPLLKQSARGLAIQKQMSGSAPAPTWNR